MIPTIPITVDCKLYTLSSSVVNDIANAQLDARTGLLLLFSHLPLAQQWSTARIIIAAV